MKQIAFLSGGLQFLFSLIATLVLVSSLFAADRPEQTLYRFQGTSDGQNPYGILIQDAAGNFYGTTEYGGAGGFYGTVFELSPPSSPDGSWTETTLYSFTNTGDGARPTAGLIFDQAGNLYGTTSDSDAGGYGEIFRLSRPSKNGGAWTETVLYSFQGKNDGAYPHGGLISDEAGNFYGTTESSVFELSPPGEGGNTWTLNVLHEFKCCDDGWSSMAGLVRDPQGNLYGTTLWGGYKRNPDCGSIGCGTVLEVSPPANPGGAWTEQLIHLFGAGDDGFDPESGLALDAKDNLYGTTYSGGRLGGGAAFELSPPGQSGGAWTETLLHSFSYAGENGAAPVGTLILDQTGNLYGTSLFGGNPCFFNGTFYGCGVVFELSPPTQTGNPWVWNVLHFFTILADAPRQPAAGLFRDAFGNLYGSSAGGGSASCVDDGLYGCGAVFKILR